MPRGRTSATGITRIKRGTADYPVLLLTRLGQRAPEELTAVGNLDALEEAKTALFCSASTPGSAILPAHDAARHMRESGATVISGFHSTIEKECLQILLRGKQPIIICPGRAIQAVRISQDLRAALEAGRLLLLSPFASTPRRVTKESATLRNELVAALADEAFIAHASPGGETARLLEKLAAWGVPVLGKTAQGG